MTQPTKNSSPPTIKCDFVNVRQRDLTFVLTTLPAWALVKMTYVSIRGVHDEEGAVQRYLNNKRIASIRDFTNEVGIFPTTLVLNWNNQAFKIERKSNILHVPVIERGAQVIDGQHRRAGIAAALTRNIKIHDFEIPVAIFENLTTQKCADIFISINTEQKPVPKSLVYDLFSEASEHIADMDIQRATDLAKFLDEESDSPYLQLIKFPSSRYERGGISLATAVAALKPLVEEKGDFEQINVSDFAAQSQILLNFFRALASPYGDRWLTSKNVFLYAAGFTAAIEFFRKRVIPYCTKKRSFKINVIANCVGFDIENLIMQDEVKGLGGKNSVATIYKRLNNAFVIDDPEENKFEI
ncbi:MAG: DGQHR domain-containing protein [Rhizobiales bacterium]|nr:DGQHR domain-containing protein [Hyphomicrobiales bacterium]